MMTFLYVHRAPLVASLYTEANGFLQLSASSAALDLALSQSPGPESQSNGWPTFNRHRPQYSLPMNALSTSQNKSQITSPKTQLPPSNASKDSPGSMARYERNSIELGFSPFSEANQGPSATTSTAGSAPQVPTPKLQGSYSTSDIPTVKHVIGSTGPNGPANTHAQQHFHNHNASLGRIPVNAVNNRHSRELSSSDVAGAVREGQNMNYQPFQSVLQPSAAPFGPPLSSPTGTTSPQSAGSPPSVPSYGNSNFYGAYPGMAPMTMNMGLNGMNGIGNIQMNDQTYPQANPFAFQMYGYSGRTYDNQARGIQHRRVADGEANRFANVQLESLRGEIYSLCKDQHGCRYLQKKLEDRDPEHIQMIFLETKQHVVELMTGMVDRSLTVAETERLTRL